MREVRAQSGLAYVVHEQPEDFATLSRRVAAESRIWLDTEVADWNTPSPRLSLIQLRLENGTIHVVDVLAPGMRAVYDQVFVPMVVSCAKIEKWAHYARFERRIIGGSLTQALKCTFELARTIPYYRLPLRSLSLARLVLHFCKTSVDKTFQKADWGQRPLPPELLDYAACDPEWCYRVWEQLRALVRNWDPPTDNPHEIQASYLAVLPLRRDAQRRRSAIWDAVKGFMVAEHQERFASFLLQTRIIRQIPVRMLATATAEVDRSRMVDFSIPVPGSLLECIPAHLHSEIRALGREIVGARFTGPVAPRTSECFTYSLDTNRPEKVAAEFETADDEHRKKDSEWQELKDRMRAWMEHAKAPRWGGFAIGQGAPRLSADVRLVAERLADGAAPATSLPARFLAAFSPDQLDAFHAHLDTQALPVLRWRPDRQSMPIELAQSRDWHGDDES